MVEKVANEFEGKVAVGKCDVSTAGDVAADYGVMGVPTLLFMKDGEVVEQHSGLLSEDAIRAKLSQLAV